ncbi:hypothetical protein [Acinetobacter bereziniae]|uniref:hypothetical protein n=1 Tax=Acinetobacter bereziniae TaxID=106648 RepID=UPI0019018A5D|nr:hypothetical protein [Acinetobacter bereziniae]MBJ9901972.1 hypothetical protein [Acinetobacter bereziniae]
MDIEKEREEFEKEAFKQSGGWATFHKAYGDVYENNQLNFAWKVWLAAKSQTTPEGFVLVPTENISTFYQDDSEPENFCTYEADLDILGDGLDKGEIMVVNKYTQAELTKEKFYGAWCEIETTFGTSRKFKIFKTYDEAKQAMVEAQEQK